MAKDATKTGITLGVLFVIATLGILSFVPGVPWYKFWETPVAPTGARLPSGLPGQIIGQPAQPATPSPTVQPAYFGQLASLSVQGRNILAGTSPDINAEVWSSDDTQYVAETRVNAALTSLATNLPNDFDGYVLLGNDNFASTTDRGTEIYYTKFPVSWRGRQGLVSYDSIPVYAEETATGANLITFYDDNTAEATANITVGSGGSYTAATIKLLSTSNECNGNPDFNGKAPLSLAFNQSTAGLMREIKPVLNDGQILCPGFLSGNQTVGCYALPTKALCDGATFITDLYYEANAGQNPGVTQNSVIIPLDKAWYREDPVNGRQKWISGYGDESDLAADADVGYDSVAAARIVFFT